MGRFLQQTQYSTTLSSLLYLTSKDQPPKHSLALDTSLPHVVVTTANPYVTGKSFSEIGELSHRTLANVGSLGLERWNKGRSHRISVPILLQEYALLISLRKMTGSRSIAKV